MRQQAEQRAHSIPQRAEPVCTRPRHTRQILGLQWRWQAGLPRSRPARHHRPAGTPPPKPKAAPCAPVSPPEAGACSSVVSQACSAANETARGGGAFCVQLGWRLERAAWTLRRLRSWLNRRRCGARSTAWSWPRRRRRRSRTHRFRCCPPRSREPLSSRRSSWRRRLPCSAPPWRETPPSCAPRLPAPASRTRSPPASSPSSTRLQRSRTQPPLSWRCCAATIWWTSRRARCSRWRSTPLPLPLAA